MTSKLTREKAQWLHDACEEAATAGIKLTMNPNELLMFTSYALAAIDSEPVGEFYEDGPLNWYQISDGDRVPAHRRIPLYRHAQPAPEYPETLPCPVLLEPGLRFGKGIKTSTMLAALARRAVHESDMAALSPEERAEFQAGIEGVKALIAQPATAFPDFDNVLESLDYEVRCNAWESEHVLKACQATYDACRAAILHSADGKPHLTVWYGSMPETNGKTNWTAMLHRKGQHPWEGITIDRSEYPDRVRYEADRMRHLIGDLADKPDILAYDADAHGGYVPPAAPQSPGSEPATVPGKWIPVSEQMPEDEQEVLTINRMGHRFVSFFDKHSGLFFDRLDAPAACCIEHVLVTHWMQLPAGPKEVK